MATSDRQFIERAVRLAIIVAASLIVVSLGAWALKGALTPLLGALLLAYLLDPVIDRFEDLGVSRELAIFLLLGLGGVALALGLVVLLPRMQQELTRVAARLPGYVETTVADLLDLLEARLGIVLPRSLEEIAEGIQSGSFDGPLEALQAALAGLLDTLTGSLVTIVGLLVVPVIAYYFLVAFDDLKWKPLALVPFRYHDYVIEKAGLVDRMVSGFVRGQLTVSLILGVLYAAGFSVIGIDLAVVIGLAAGALAIIPYLGNALAVTLATGMSILEFGIDRHLLFVLGWYATVQTLEGYVLTPRIVGSALGLSPVTVIVALLIGGDLFGFLGLLIAIPAAAVIQVFASEWLGAYQASGFYRSATPLSEAAEAPPPEDPATRPPPDR